jgi:hypothetical protein
VTEKKFEDEDKAPSKLSFDRPSVASRVDLLKVLRYLPERGPITAKLFPGSSPRRQWINWVSDHRHQDARVIFNRLESPRMIMWLAEASGIERRPMSRAAAAISKVANKSAQAAAIRQILPWSLVESHLERIDQPNDATDDIEEILSDTKIRSETTRKALIEARRGMGEFRSALKRRWKNQCAVTGCALSEILRASHMKPWSISNNDERLNPANGILLAAHIDALFDRGLISFSDSGAMLLSARIVAKDRTMFGLPLKLRFKLSKTEKQFLKSHRERFSF